METASTMANAHPQIEARNDTPPPPRERYPLGVNTDGARRGSVRSVQSGRHETVGSCEWR